MPSDARLEIAPADRRLIEGALASMEALEQEITAALVQWSALEKQMLAVDALLVMAVAAVKRRNAIRPPANDHHGR
jgi:hypothetical protein